MFLQRPQRHLQVCAALVAAQPVTYHIVGAADDSRSDVRLSGALPSPHGGGSKSQDKDALLESIRHSAGHTGVKC